MLKKNLVFLTLVIFLAGCGTEVRTYVMTKDRVGLDRGNGNGGCVIGTCPPTPAPAETTRKVYVLEITKPVPESEVKKIEDTAVNAITETSSSGAAVPVVNAPDNTQPQAPAAASPQVSVPVVGELPGTLGGNEPSSATPAAVDNSNAAPGSTYTVQKDDTLQKISKKVYGTYRHWYKIYKANKEKIGNPNVLQPGTVLTLPEIK